MKRALAWLSGVVIATAVAGAVAADEALEAGGVNPGYHPQPEWFKQSFLDLPEDIAEASAAGRRVLLYFYQDGCPYCAKLLEENFGRPAIVRQTREHFDVVAINIWGDREAVDLDGASVTEKHLAEALGVMYTPTLLFLDEAGERVLRINGYYPPQKFTVALEYAAKPRAVDYPGFLAARRSAPAGGDLNPQPFFQSPPHALARTVAPAERPLAVLFEQPDCAACDEFHRDVLDRPRTRELLGQFDVVQLDRWGKAPVLTPDGQRLTAQAWADALGVQYSPTLVFFDRRGREVFRTEAYLRAFHTQSALDYVASGAYREQPNFQRFVQARADRLEAAGEHVDLME